MKPSTKDKCERAKAEIKLRGRDVPKACEIAGISVPTYYIYKRREENGAQPGKRLGRPRACQPSPGDAVKSPLLSATEMVNNSTEVTDELVKLRKMCAIQANIIAEYLGFKIEAL